MLGLELLALVFVGCGIVIYKFTEKSDEKKRKKLQEKADELGITIDEVTNQQNVVFAKKLGIGFVLLLLFIMIFGQ